MEYLNGGSLRNVLESVGALPENILLDLTHSVLHGLNFIHNKAKVRHNGLSMSQIMFNREGKIKLNPFSTHEITAPTMKSKLSMFNDFTPGDTTEDTEKSKGELFAQDIFDLGYILLICAIGGIDIINPEVLDLKEKGDT